VGDRHLAAGRDALLHALETSLGDDFTAEARVAWRELYDLAAAVMRRASERAHVGTATGAGGRSPH
jgi:hemoglobin-like flavoprotein